MKDYWKEATTSAFEEVGIVLTDEQLKQVASSLQISHENIGMAFGHVENPLRSELDNEKEKHKRDLEQAEKQLEGIRKGVAIRRHCDPCDVSIDKNGRVTYDGPRW